MNRRNFMQMIGCLPFLGFLKKAEPTAKKSMPGIIKLGEFPYTVPMGYCALVDHWEVDELGGMTVWGYLVKETRA